MDRITRQPEELEGVPLVLSQLYQEIIKAYNAKLDLLVLAGSRMMLEGICEALDIPDMVLAERLKLLESRLDSKSGHLATVAKICNLAVHERRIEDSDDADLCLGWAEVTLKRVAIRRLFRQ